MAAAVLLLLAPVVALADGARHTLWAVQGRHNTVYLLGSVHVLKPVDSALPVEAQAAYAHAQTLVMEVALDDAALQGAVQASMLAQGMLPEGQTLEGVLGAALYARLQAQAAALGLNARLVNRFQPWLAAMALQQAQLSRAGYDPGAGVDMQFAVRAQADRKSVIGLETLEEQLGFFSQLTPEQQRELLRQTLDEVAQGDAEVEEIVTAWKLGDTRRLDQLLEKSRRQSPDLFRLLTTERNRRWLPRIVALLGEEQDCLVIVGAMHLVGPEGLVELLQKQGYRAVQE
jgi:uncharacterized protein YbaP (TraB family)